MISLYLSFIFSLNFSLPQKLQHQLRRLICILNYKITMKLLKILLFKIVLKIKVLSDFDFFVVVFLADAIIVLLFLKSKKSKIENISYQKCILQPYKPRIDFIFSQKLLRPGLDYKFIYSDSNSVLFSTYFEK